MWTEQKLKQHCKPVPIHTRLITVQTVSHNRSLLAPTTTIIADDCEYRCEFLPGKAAK